MMVKSSILILFLMAMTALGCTKDRKLDLVKQNFAGYEKVIPDAVSEAAIDRSNLITIDIPGSFSGGQDHRIEFDKLIDSVYYVKLETSNNCLIGNIDKIIPIKDRLIIIERLRRKSVLMFSRAGKFLTEIGKTGKGPGEYASLSDVTVDKNKNEIILFDGRKRKRLFFDLDGKFLREEMTYFYCTDFAVLSNGNYMYVQSPDVNIHLPGVSNYNMIITTPDQVIIKKVFLDEISDQLPNFKNFDNIHNLGEVGSGVLFSPKLCDTIFEINSNGVKAKYHLNMGDKYVLWHLEKHNTVDDYLKKMNEEKLYDFNGVTLETTNCLFFNIANVGSCFYKKRTGELIYGNTFSYTSDKIVDVCMPVGATNSFFIGVLWPHSIYPSGREFDKSIAQMLEGLKREDNPILFFYAIKD